MRPRRLRPHHALAALALLASLLVSAPAGSTDTHWIPAGWKDVDTLEMLTVGPEEGEYWFKLWLVVIDGDVYVRLGTRATERVQGNATAPYVGIRIGGQQFDRVKLIDAPERAEQVAGAMAQKYWSDVLIRLFPHPMTARLEPDTAE
jgi:hypothetical protein